MTIVFKFNSETNYVSAALEANGYPSSVISTILNKKPPPPTVPPPEELISLFFKWVEPSDTYQVYACLPYISGLTEPLTRLLRNHEIRVVNKPFKTLQQQFPSPKYRQPSDFQCDVVYKIPCKDCSWNYIEETGRCFQTRKKEHQRNLKNYSKGSNVANHAWLNNHSIDFDNACAIDKGNYRVRKALESWHTAKTVDADNNSKPLPKQYSIFLQLDFIYILFLSLFHTFFVFYFLKKNFALHFVYISIRALTFFIR